MPKESIEYQSLEHVCQPLRVEEHVIVELHLLVVEVDLEGVL
jgi:hypothetical protein